MVNGVDISANTEPTLVTTEPLTVTWTAGDPANTDLLGLYLMDMAAMNGQPPMYPLAAGATDYTFPAGTLQPGIYAWLAVQWKVDPATYDEMAEGFSTWFGPGMEKSMVVYGPDNLLGSTQGAEHAVGQIGVQVDSSGGAYDGVTGFSGTYIFGEDTGGFQSDIFLTYAGLDAGGVAVTTDTEYFAYEDPDLVITDMISSVGKGYMGHTAVADLFTQVQGSDPDNVYLTVGSTRAMGPFDAAELNGTWSVVVVQVGDDGVGNFAGAWCAVGNAVLASTSATTGDATLTMTGQDGGDASPFGSLAYSLDTMTGEFLMDLVDGPQRGYVGGGANKDIIVLQTSSDATEPFLFVMAKQTDLVDESSVQGTYNFVNFWLEQDVSGGPPYTLHTARTGWGTLTFDGTSVVDGTYTMLDGEAGSDSDTYSVDGAGETISAMGFELVAGPDEDTIFGIQVGADDSIVNVLIATK